MTPPFDHARIVVRDYRLVSSIRVFILGSLEAGGAMHGYQLRVIANESNIQNWTDITPGAIYGALKRLVNEGLVREVRSERDGARPQRQIVDITDEGRAEVRRLRMSALTDFRLPADPFDLAFARPGAELLEELPQIIATRRQMIDDLAAEYAHRITTLSTRLTALEELTMRHRLSLLHAEVAYADEVLTQLPSILKEERGTTA